MKLKHNKKRNTAFLYESLVRELTKAVLSKNTERKATITSLIKEHFKKGEILAQDLECYRSLSETDSMEPYTAEKLICEIRNIRSQMDKKKLFSRQTRLINDVNKKLSDKVFSNFVPNYRSLATIYQIFDSELPVKKRVILEQNILAGMVSLKGEKEGTMKPIDNVVFKTFSKKFNEQYSGSLLEEQKELLKHYIFSFSDNGLSLKVYLNEELGRLKTILVSSLREEDVENDEEMTSKTRNIISMLEEYTQNKLDEKVIKKIMKIQGLVQELDS